MDRFLNKKRNFDENEFSNENSLNAKKPRIKKANRPNRKCDDTYLNFGFSWTGNEDQSSPLCLVCGCKMSNKSMLPSKLSRHLKSKHPHLQGRDLSYFKRLLEQNRKQACIFKSKMTVSEKAQIASLEISNMLAQNLKSHTLAKLIILPACRKLVKTMLGDEAEKKINKIPLSNDTVRRRILALSADIEENVSRNKLKNLIFVLQVDESTDITNKAHLQTFIRFIDGDQIVNQFLFCIFEKNLRRLPTSATSQLMVFNAKSQP